MMMENQDPSNYLLTLDQVSYLPLSTLLPHQIEVLQKSPKRFKTLIWHRKARKTTTAIYEVVKQAHLRIGVYWHIFPTYGEAFDSIWNDPNMLFNIIPKALIDHVNATNLIVYFKNGSIYQLKGSDDPDALRGPNPFGVVFDEFDTQKREAWGVIEPILRANGGWAWFIGTPRGRQQLYDFYNRGQTDHKEWASWLIKASNSGIIDLEQLEEARKSMTEALYSQEFECEFLESAGSVFRGVREIMVARPQRPIAGRLYLMGVDLAKVQDWTVVRIYDRETNELVYKDRWQTIEWPYQKKKIATYAKYYNDALTILDATGLGDPIADDLTRAGVGIVPFKITSQNKKELIEKLSLWIEQKNFKIMKDEVAALEYDNFTYKLGENGQAKYGAREGYHDDIVMADALAVWYLHKVYVPEFTIEPTPTQIAFARAKNEYEREAEMKDDHEDAKLWEEWADDGYEGGL